MNLPDKRIVDFINDHHVLTLATSVDDEPWCCNCFYVYIPEDNCFVITSDLTTKHIQHTAHNIFVAGSVVLETSTVGKIQGLQFTGVISAASGDQLKRVKKAYLKKFPVATLMKTTLWTVDATKLKLTDNRLGFGKKLNWEKELCFDN